MGTKILSQARRVLFGFLALLTPLQTFANWSNQSNAIDPENAGAWTPTDAGLVVQLHEHDVIRLSTVINGKEYFVCDYQNLPQNDPKNPFKYPTDSILKLLPRNSDGSYPSGSKWKVGKPLANRKSNLNIVYDLVTGIDGIVYTMWSDEERTLVTEGDDYTITNGKLRASDAGLGTSNSGPGLCDVVFAIPTVQSRTNMDPNNTLEKTYPFDGQMGVDTLGNVWREVYWFHKSRKNGPCSYAAFGLTAFSTGNGRAYQINGKKNGKSKQRMLFRLYIVGEHPFEFCPDSYFFAHDEQNYLKFLKFTSLPINTKTDSTAARKIYTHEHMHRMERIGNTKYFQSSPYQIPTEDSTYFYIGKNNEYYSAAKGVSLGSAAGAYSAFTKIRQLRISHLADADTPFIAPAKAYGRIVVDSTSAENNLGATFKPSGYFFKIINGRNVPMRQVDDSTWITDEMWTIEGDYMLLSGKVMLYTQETFSEADPGADIAGWSKWQKATKIPVYNHPGMTAANQSGWARIHVNRTDSNGGIDFVLANTANHYIEYSNNGHFGEELPRLYPVEGSTTVRVQEPRLLEGYTFYGWNTQADTTAGVLIAPGTVIDFNNLPSGVTLENGVLKLYAKAKYVGSINVAISFMQGGKRYFITNPTPASSSFDSDKYFRARSYSDWTNVWQGMGNMENTDTTYLSSFRLIGQTSPYPGPCVECGPDEYVLDRRPHTQRGNVDSLVFYGKQHPDTMAYIGLYYDPEINILLSNNNWAGLFTSSEGWPTPVRACVDSTRISSAYYLSEWPSNTKTPRNLPPEIKYNATEKHFDGVAVGTGTDFMISGVGVVDAHYVILPDTLTPWTDSIMFGYHESPIWRDVWSKLIGKQLLAQMKVGEDTIYFHPNRDKIIENAQGLVLSSDFRLTHEFSFIPDARVEPLHVVADEDTAAMVETADAFHCRIVSGESSPIGLNFDIVDTLRVWLRPASTSKIKKYYGSWNNNAPGVHVLPNGSRYRDILITTKTYHYGPNQVSLRLVPSKEIYTFGSLDNVSETVNFALKLTTSRQLLDAAGNPVREEISAEVDTTDLLDLTSATFRLGRNDVFSIGTRTATGIRLTTQSENLTSMQRDTLTVTTTVTINDTPTRVSVRVPLQQVATFGAELIWSVKDGDNRYFITADSTGLDYRQYSMKNSRLVWGDNKDLYKGSKDATNSDKAYITPWKWTDIDADNYTLTLKTEYGVNRSFSIVNDVPTSISGDEASILTFVFDTTYVNDDGNYEEIVRLKYGNSPTYWLKFNGTSRKLELTTDSLQASLFSWAYMSPKYYLLNSGDYPSKTQEEFTYNSNRTGSIQTRYQAYLDHTMLLGNKLVYLCKTKETTVKNLINPSKDWKTQFTDTIIRDSRVSVSSGLRISRVDTSSVKTNITADGPSPRDVMYKGKYVNIVDTLDFRITLQPGAPEYRFADKWTSFSSLENAHLKIPLIRRTYHEAPYDSVVCLVDHDEYNFAFPAFLREGVRTDSVHSFKLYTERHTGTNVLNVYNEVAEARQDESEDYTEYMDLTNAALAEIRIVDAYGNKPAWCDVIGRAKDSITVKCYSNGIRSPRVAYIHLAYMLIVDGKRRFVKFRLSVSQASYFQYANNQTLFHSAGASGDPLMPDGRQQTHENRRILYYYNPEPYAVADQDVELPVRERGFYGWWRWYREGKDQNKVDVSDTDIPDSVWIKPPLNDGGTGNNHHAFPFRIIGDSVKVKDEITGDSVKVLATMGRYTVFWYPSSVYGNKNDPPSKNPKVKPPFNKDTVTYVVDISNYYENLPLSTIESRKNQIDTALLEKMDTIIEPTLSLREVFELHPWTEMAARLDTFKVAYNASGVYTDEKYMEDHVVMAPTGNRLLLKTEQRYRYDNLQAKGYSESLLGYYMRDDNWALWNGDKDRQDTMIWCGGWINEPQCLWFTYDPTTHKYTSIDNKVNVDEDFLEVLAKGGISDGHDFDTVYYCLRARSKATNIINGKDSTVDGNYWFNICRYKIIYHDNDPDVSKYGPKLETRQGGVMKAIITNDEIEEDYEVLERLNFDYNKPGSDYTIYPHPLPWADASYGYSYPLSSSALQNRYHNEKDFPGPGEYALINKIPYDTWWRTIKQHGDGKDDDDEQEGYMIYCDGMSAAGQVAALKLQSNLCEGQKLFFSGYVGNVSNQTKKSNPNFTFSVQGSVNDTIWEDITSYMTGDIEPSDNWYQIVFPIEHEKKYDYFRVLVYNMASSFDGNDFVIDDLCVFATKPPLIAYQAQTRCVEQNEADSVIHVVLRVDYKGFIDDHYNNDTVFYTVEQMTLPDSVFSYVRMEDGYMNEGSRLDTIFGRIKMPAKSYDPTSEDTIFVNLNQLADYFERSYTRHEQWAKDSTGPEPELHRTAYIYENLDGDVRPVLYIVHKAKMVAQNKYKVRMSLSAGGLISSQCAMTSDLNVTNRMVLMLNGLEREDKVVSGICGNVTHDIGLRVRGTLIQDSVAPIDLAGSCVNDWLLYGDTSEVSSLARYGYKYSDIVHVVKDILRYEPMDGEQNGNQFARNLGEINRKVLNDIKRLNQINLFTADEPYDIIANLVNKGFLLLYQSDLMVSLASGDSVQYVVFPILGTGKDEIHNLNMEVCPTPLVIKLKSKPNEGGSPLVIGGLHRDSTQLKNPVIVLSDAITMAEGIMIPVDSIRDMIGISSIELVSTDDPNFRTGVHHLEMTPDRKWPGDAESYYERGDTIYVTPSSSSNYTMRQGYNYTYNIEMVNLNGESTQEGCPIGHVYFTLSYVPDYLRWNPRNTENNLWNNPDNWIGITAQNKAIHDYANFAPLPSTKVVIPAMSDGLPYPELPGTITSRDSVQEVGFTYNICDAIRFLPGAAIGQQQHLTYNDVIIDMDLPQQKWAFRSAPVAGMLSGDLFISNSDKNTVSNPWEVGEFDAPGRSWKSGSTSFWLSVYNRSTIHKEEDGKDSVRSADADWSKVTNGLTLPLSSAQGWAVYTRTADGSKPIVRLPKNDDVYYYYNAAGEKQEAYYESGLRALRETNANGGKAGKFAFYPDSVGDPHYELTNEASSEYYVFGNPTMGYIDIWGLVADNSLGDEISYMDESGKASQYTPITKAAALLTTDTINNLQRYLPPMGVMVIKASAAGTKLRVKLMPDRIVTSHTQTVRRAYLSAAPIRNAAGRSKGIMTVTAVNPVSDRCVSRLLLGQGYHDEIRAGEDAMLATININNYTNNTMPATPFNIYAIEGDYGLSIDLRDEVVNVPLSFYFSDLPFDPVTNLWFTGVNALDGSLVLYDALTGEERLIIDGICLDIETPEANHEKRYYIRRAGYTPGQPVTTDVEEAVSKTEEQAVKIIKNGHVLILRNGHVYTIFGQQLR